MLVLEYVERQGSLEYTRRALDALQAELKHLADQQNNESLRELLDILEV